LIVKIPQDPHLGEFLFIKFLNKTSGMDTIIFFDNWESLFRTLIIGILAYVILIFMLRVSGKRTLSKMNAFDFIVTVALGSTLATVILSKDIPLLEGSLAFFLLIFMQYTITSLSVKNKKIKDLVTSKPVLLFFKGEILWDMMKKERVTVEDLHLAIRKKGITDIALVDVVILETTGDITVIQEITVSGQHTLKDLKNYPRKQ
jgi:uncharacterized membrane protein YcaP (DUF421 family)